MKRLYLDFTKKGIHPIVKRIEPPSVKPKEETPVMVEGGAIVKVDKPIELIKKIKIPRTNIKFVV